MKSLKLFANAKNEKFDNVDANIVNLAMEEKTRGENVKHNSLIDATSDVEAQFAASKISVNSHKEKSSGGYL